MQPISIEKKQRILELYLCGNDVRITFIAETVKSSPYMVSSVIQDYFDRKIQFTRGNFKIIHSSINYKE